ncbi:MAG TPA: N-acetylmuramoyl-L-alanine amidase [Planctomycetes bacterium]|nr:N-acetylmuramoyl-L-alanine amidase [Planctomycetota bacterium]
MKFLPFSPSPRAASPSPLAILLLVLALGACRSTPPALHPGDPHPRLGDEIMVCGQLFHTGTRVVLWTDPGGYDAYRLDLRFPAETAARKKKPEGARYGSLRRSLPESLKAKAISNRLSVSDLAEQVQQFVLHYDVCGTSRQCFKVLQDMRGLSVHFMLDVDGTIYQTLDLKERAWHAGKANDRSVGVEIAHIGAYPAPDHKVLASWYPGAEGQKRIRFPEWMKETGIRGPGPYRPARKELLHGNIQGRELWQYDFTQAQYRALAHLLATLNRVLPGIRLDYPRDKDGKLLTKALSPKALQTYKGVLGHFHVTTRKTDPGPAMNWDRLLREARALRFGTCP